MKTKRVKIFHIVSIALLSTFLVSGCSDATKAAINAWGVKHRITLFSGGKIVGQWESTGKIENESDGDGRFFRDDKTGLLVSISGTYSIEVITNTKVNP